MADQKTAARRALRLFGERISGHRRSLGLSRLDLAELAGLHVNTIGHIERADVDVSLLATSRVLIRLGCLDVAVGDEGFDPSAPSIDPRAAIADPRGGSAGAPALSSAAIVAVTGARVRDRRRDLGMSIEELAGAAGLHRNTVWNCERGLVVPSMASMFRMFSALGVRLVKGNDGLPHADPYEGFFRLN